MSVCVGVKFRLPAKANSGKRDPTRPPPLPPRGVGSTSNDQLHKQVGVPSDLLDVQKWWSPSPAQLELFGKFGANCSVILKGSPTLRAMYPHSAYFGPKVWPPNST